MGCLLGRASELKRSTQRCSRYDKTRRTCHSEHSVQYAQFAPFQPLGRDTSVSCGEGTPKCGVAVELVESPLGRRLALECGKKCRSSDVAFAGEASLV
mmetsp:Transcript_119105/g.216490  ORF Transcript_119105/g.216490 Transcript_119105/m.216490 type:complete len:98 (-) Transcript_119105:2066-2359(-)